MIMIGCDFHPGQQQIAVLDTETGRRSELRLTHQGDSVRQFYASLPAPVRVGDPAQIREAAPRKQKTDRRDAQLLLQLLEEKRFPRIWVPDRATRDLRQLLLHRHKLVTMRTALGNQLQAIALNHNVQQGRRLWSEAGRRQLQSLALPHWTERRRDDLLRLLDLWDTEIAELDRVVVQEAEARPDARYLIDRQPGVGPITALATVLTLGPVERFASAKKVASYVGLIPAERSSGPHQRLGHLTKQGSPFLRFLLVEAAHTAVRRDPGFKRAYWRLVERRGKPIAQVAMARKLLTHLYWMLRLRNNPLRSASASASRGPRRAVFARWGGVAGKPGA
jgi:transposase